MVIYEHLDLLAEFGGREIGNHVHFPKLRWKLIEGPI